MVTLTGLGGLGRTRTHTKQVAQEVASRFPILQFWGWGSTGSHNEGRALDIMVFTNNRLSTSASLGESIYKALWADRKRLGIEYIIWNRTITSTVVSPGQRRNYTGPNPHTDHVHVTFLKNAPPYQPFLSFRGISPRWFNAAWLLDQDGRNNPSHPVGTKYAQLALNVALKLQLDPDGWHGPGTHAAMQAYQVKLGHPKTDKITWAEWSQLGKDSGVFKFTPPTPPKPEVPDTPDVPVAEVSFSDTVPHRTEVGYLQRALNKVVKSDCHGGFYDLETFKAVQEFQGTLGATKDGTLSYSQFQSLASASGLYIAKP